MTATFDTAVTGVAVNDFNGGSPFPTVSGIAYSVAAGAGNAWILSITLNHSPRNTQAWSFASDSGSGSISHPNAASATPLALTYVVCCGGVVWAHPMPRR